MKRRKQNPGLLSALPWVGLAATGAFAVWVLVDAKSAGAAYRAGRKKIEDTTGARLPRPDVRVVGPQTEEEFAELADLIEEVSAQVCSDVNVTDEMFPDVVAMKVLNRLYADFPWPAIAGDHPSTAELQGLVRYTVAHAGRGRLCAAEVVEEDQVDDDDDDDIVPLPEE